MTRSPDTSTYRRTERGQAVRRRRARLRRRARTASIAAAGLLLCVALAFFLAPTGHASRLALVQINGETAALPPDATTSRLSAFSAVLARPGSSLNLTGDVIDPTSGSAPLRQIDGLPATGDHALTDGDVLLVRQGGHTLEPLRRVTQAMASQVSVAGSGNVVSLVREGNPGEREIFKGVSSGKQAAIFVTREPLDTLLQRADTVESGQKLAALTFDDGPSANTQQVLDALAAKHVPATFFVLGSSAAGNKSLISSMRAAGHEVENHTWSHADLTKVTETEFRSQVSRTNAVIGGSRYLRPPYGSSNDTVKKIAASMGMRLAFWTVDTLDWQKQDVGAIMAHVRSGVRPGAILLMHDGGGDRRQTIAAIPVMVDWLFAQGYSLTTIGRILD